MKIRFVIIAIGLVIILTFITYIILDINSFTLTLNNNTNISMNNSTSTISKDVNSSPTSIQFYNDNDSLLIPSNDYIINNINWSSYPNLAVGYIDLAEAMEPNEYVSHKFMAIGVKTEVKNTDNDTIIQEQLSSVARDVRRICGPNTAIVIMGMDHGVLAWSVTMRVYDDNIY
jgi:hypothetical protein